MLFTSLFSTKSGQCLQDVMNKLLQNDCNVCFKSTACVWGCQRKKPLQEMGERSRSLRLYVFICSTCPSFQVFCIYWFDLFYLALSNPNQRVSRWESLRDWPCACMCAVFFFFDISLAELRICFPQEFCVAGTLLVNHTGGHLDFAS